MRQLVRPTVDTSRIVGSTAHGRLLVKPQQSTAVFISENNYSFNPPNLAAATPTTYTYTFPPATRRIMRDFSIRFTINNAHATLVATIPNIIRMFSQFSIRPNNFPWLDGQKLTADEAVIRAGEEFLTLAEGDWNNARKEIRNHLGHIEDHLVTVAALGSTTVELSLYAIWPEFRRMSNATNIQKFVIDLVSFVSTGTLADTSIAYSTAAGTNIVPSLTLSDIQLITREHTIADPTLQITPFVLLEQRHQTQRQSVNLTTGASTAPIRIKLSDFHGRERVNSIRFWITANSADYTESSALMFSGHKYIRLTIRPVGKSEHDIDGTVSDLLYRNRESQVYRHMYGSQAAPDEIMFPSAAEEEIQQLYFGPMTVFKFHNLSKYGSQGAREIVIISGINTLMQNFQDYEFTVNFTADCIPIGASAILHMMATDYRLGIPESRDIIKVVPV